MNLNPHVHSLLPDGLFVPGVDGSATLTFVPLPEPTAEDIEVLTYKIARRLTAVVERLSADECETAAVLERTAAALREALAKAVEPPLPKSGLDLQGLGPEAMSAPLCAKVAGFSLHASRVVDEWDREGLERLCRYGLRAPFSQERLSQREDGRVAYHLRRPWPNAAGATCLLLDPTDLLRRLAALVPAPYANLVRYHGVFAGRSHSRARLPRPPAEEADDQAAPQSEPEPQVQTTADRPDPASTPIPAMSPTPQGGAGSRRRRTLPWARLLRRVFFLDALSCPRCAAPMVVLALISDPQVVRKILLHLGLPADLPPLSPAAHRDVEPPLFDEDAASVPSARPPS
jgi:hypothetical protein